MARIVLKGLNYRQNSTGKWYVSIRATGQPIVKGFEGSKRDLLKHMASPQFLERYNIARRARQKKTYEDGTFGALVDWYQTRPAWTGLRDRTKSDYQKVLLFLEPTFPYNVLEITKADVADMRDRAIALGKVKFSNDVIAVMSVIFSEAEEAGRMPANPALGVKRKYKPSRAANRRWTDNEWETVFQLAPASLKVPLSIIRWAGLRGEDVHMLVRSAYRQDAEMGRVLRFRALKNGELVETGVVPALRAVLDPHCKDMTPKARICRNSLSLPYPTANAMRKAWHDFKCSGKFTTALPNSADLTLHGLRVTYASAIKEAGFDDRSIADAIGDKSESMGHHYSRGADKRRNIVRIHKRMSETKNGR